MQYGFGGRLTAEFPSQLIVDSTEICNLACIHCPHPQFKKSEHYAGRFLDPSLNAKLVAEVASAGKGLARHIRYTGEGEPLIHPRIFEMLELAVRESGVPVSVTTNGTLLDAPRAERLLACGVDLIDISLDAHSPETYAAVRVNGDLAVTRANVLGLIRLARQNGSSTKVVVSYVEQPQNLHETAAFESFWKGEGADFVVVRRLHSSAGAVAPVAITLRQTAAAEKRRPCLYPWERLVLNPRGELCFCPQDWVHGSVLADYREATIRGTWTGDAYQRLRKAHLDDEFSDHGFCGQCPDWRETRWPAEGRSYADMVAELGPSHV